jgi:hypothetical protein
MLPAHAALAARHRPPAQDTKFRAMKVFCLVNTVILPVVKGMIVVDGVVLRARV